MNYNQKIEQLKKELVNNNYHLTYSYLILKMIDKGTLDELINEITNTKTKVYITTLRKKNNMSANEQFIYLLNNFIYQFKEDFYFLNSNFEYIIETLLQDTKYTNYLLCKKYLGNNNNISYFSTNTKKLIISGFYYNIKKLANKSEIIKKFTKDNKINLKKNLINYKEETDMLYDLLIKIALCNTKELNNNLLFESIKHYTDKSINIYKNKEIISSVQKYYIINWQNMIKNYYEKEKILTYILK